MALTRDFKELVQKWIARDPASGDALLREGIDRGRRLASRAGAWRVRIVGGMLAGFSLS
jgi:hypothetical protein